MLLATGLAGSAAVAGDLSFEMEVRDYRVRGTSARGLVSYMRQRPFAGDNGPAFANVRPRYSLKLETEHAGGSCRVVDVELDIRFVMTLPKAMDEARMDRTTRSHWLAFRRFAARHEETHRRFYLTCARRFLKTVRRMEHGGSCLALRREAREALDAADRDCNRLHDSFDAREVPRLGQLALFRAARARPAKPEPSTARPGAVVHAAFRFSGAGGRIGGGPNGP